MKVLFDALVQELHIYNYIRIVIIYS